MKKYTSEELEKIIWEKGEVDDFTFERNYKPNDLDILKLNLSGNTCFLCYLQGWLEENNISNIERINVHIWAEHFSYDGVPILILEIFVNNHSFKITYIYD